MNKNYRFVGNTRQQAFTLISIEMAGKDQLVCAFPKPADLPSGKKSSLLRSINWDIFPSAILVIGAIVQIMWKPR